MKRNIQQFAKILFLAVILVGLARLTDFDVVISAYFTRPLSPASNSTNVVTAPDQGRVAYLTPQEEAKTFVLEDGYSLELVLSDPVIKEPVLTVFDGNGRMFVAEMRTYMQTINGKDEKKRTSCVSVHWSEKKNGVYDRHAIFADNLLLPRMILPLADGVIINETDSDDYYIYRDSKGDGVADSKKLLFAGGKRGSNLEHQPGGLIWCMDNYLYTPVNAYRLRIKGTNVINEPTPANMGQWGLCQDDFGKPWFINAGSESGPLRFQEPIIYGIPDFKEQREPGWATVWPLVGLADVEGGEARFRAKDKTLNHFTSTCGDAIYRGDRLPSDLRGDLLYAEPVGRLIRRDRILDIEGLTRLHSVYTNSEFIRSTDPNFRPVNIANAPDGSLYITDMYRGLIQDREWVTRGSYLRRTVLKYQLDANVGRGRIWRLVHKDFKPDRQPKLLDASSAELVQTLAHPNGWWRDTAQQLLVQRGDKSIVHALSTMALNHADTLAQIHAIWTLEGLDALDSSLLAKSMANANPKVRIAALRASESLFLKGDNSLASNVVKLAEDTDPNVIIQAMLTANRVHLPDSSNLVERTVSISPFLGVKKIGDYLISSQRPFGSVATQSGFHGPVTNVYTAIEHKRLVSGEGIYNQLCFACHGIDGNGTPLQGAQPGATLAPAFTTSSTIKGNPDDVISIVLKGLSGPVDGRSYTAQMVPMENNDDEWIASVVSYIRANFGNHSSLVTERDVARNRVANRNRSQPWTLLELENTHLQHDGHVVRQNHGNPAVEPPASTAQSNSLE